MSDKEDNVFQLVTAEKEKEEESITVQAVLDMASEQGLDKVLVCGTTTDGRMAFMTNFGEAPMVLFALEKAKQLILGN